MKKFNIDTYLNNVGSVGYRKAYEKIFADMGLNHSFYDSNVLILCKIEYFKKLGRKSYPTKPTTTEYTLFTMEQFLNCCTGKLFFHDRVSKISTSYGYIPHTFTCSNDDNSVKVRRTFTYLNIDKLLEKGGFRERDILENLNIFECDFSESGGYNVVRFVAENGNSCEYSLSLGRFTN